VDYNRDMNRLTLIQLILLAIAAVLPHRACSHAGSRVTTMTQTKGRTICDKCGYTWAEWDRRDYGLGGRNFFVV
jgi:ribosomal protein S27AE